MGSRILSFSDFKETEVNEGIKELLVASAISLGLLSSSNSKAKEESDLNGPEYCKSIYNDSTLEKAKEFWTKWLMDPSTIKKISRNYKTSEEDIIKNYTPKWLDVIKPVKIVYKNMGANSIAGVDTVLKNTALYVNPQSLVFKTKYRDKYQEDAIRTMVHELQHKMSILIPINPDEIVNLAFGESQDPRSGKYKQLGDDVINRVGLELGIQDMKPFKWRVFYYWDIFHASKNTNKYAKSPTEITSRIDALKYKYGIKPGESHKIKPEMFKSTFTRESVDADLDWILVVWAGCGFPPLQEFLNKLDELAINTEKNKSDLV